jgi:hypothetical protein
VAATGGVLLYLGLRRAERIDPPAGDGPAPASPAATPPAVTLTPAFGPGQVGGTLRLRF